MSTPLPPWMPDPAEFERMLRERYEPIVSAEDYARLRELCGLGAVIEGEVVNPDLEPGPSAETIASVLAIVDAPYQPGLDVRLEDDQ